MFFVSTGLIPCYLTEHTCACALDRTFPVVNNFCFLKLFFYLSGFETVTAVYKLSFVTLVRVISYLWDACNRTAGRGSNFIEMLNG